MLKQRWNRRSSWRSDSATARASSARGSGSSMRAAISAAASVRGWEPGPLHPGWGVVGGGRDGGGQFGQWQRLFDARGHQRGGLGQVLVAWPYARGLGDALAVVAGAQA